MAQAYTPGLTVKESALIEKVRRLPLEGEVLVSEGDRVEADTVVARTHLPGGVYPMNAASLLNVEPSQLHEVMFKGPGDPVSKGEVLGRSRGIFGLFRTPLISPVEGELENISKVTGQLILREPPVPVEVRAYVDGRVCEVLPGEGVVVRTRAAFIQGIFGIGGEGRGEIVMKVSRPDEVFAPEAVTEADRGKILVGGAFLPAETYDRAREAGAAGVITGGVRYGDLKTILGYEIGVAITGAEDLGTPLVVTEGFGAIAMSRHTFDLIERFAGRSASITGATQIRAGVIRPELIVPLGDEAGDEAGERGPLEAPLEIGTPVRIIRDPRFGAVGEVVELPAEARPMSSETLTRVVVIRLEEGETVELPRANVEIIAR